ncbi:MAG TPA: cupin domain-containing protein [Polyangiales bacterium]|nr:cupin domain-containing protein [Polyangiales bacterium]
MKRSDKRALDAFLQDLGEEIEPHEAELLSGAGLLAFGDALEAIEPPPALRTRLLDELTSKGRFARFAEGTAKLLDIGLEQAKALLDRLDELSNFEPAFPGASFFWVDGGPSVANAVRGFIRVKAGTDFPEHEHIGDEIVLVLQGSFVDTTCKQAYGVGAQVLMPAGTSHEYTVPADGPDLLKLSVTQQGLRALGQTFLPR